MLCNLQWINFIKCEQVFSSCLPFIQYVLLHTDAINLNNFCIFFSMLFIGTVSSSFETFWLTLKPSSVIRMLDVVTHDLKLKIMLCEPHARDYKECFCESFKLKACQTFIDVWDDNVVIPSIRIFHRNPSFKEELLMVMWLMSNDFNIVKVHLMMTLVDMACNFGISIEHQNSLFVLRQLIKPTIHLLE